MTWPCAQCGGVVELRSGPGRTALYRLGLNLPIPEWLEIPTCTQCGETFVDGDLEAPIEAALEAAYREWQASHGGSKAPSEKRNCKHPQSAIVSSGDGERETCLDCGQWRHNILGERSAWLLPSTEFIP